MFAVLFAAVYGAIDEFHQSFNPNRMGQWQDVVLDTLGATVGVMAVWTLWRRRLRP